MMTSTQVVETSVNVTTNSSSQDYTHPDDHNLPTYAITPGFKPFPEVYLIHFTPHSGLVGATITVITTTCANKIVDIERATISHLDSFRMPATISGVTKADLLGDIPFRH